MNSDQYREAAHAAVEEIAKYYDDLPNAPVLPSVAPGYLGPLMPDEPPREGQPWPEIQADIERLIKPGLTHWQSPNFMAFFPCNSSFPGMLGDMYSGAFNAAAFNWICSPAITELETIVMDWVAKMLALPEGFLSKGEGGGIIQGTASEVIVTAVVAARERYLRRTLAHMPEGEEKLDKMAEMRGKLVALGSEHAHSSTQKAAIIAGTRFRTVPAGKETQYGVSEAALRTTIEELKAKGLEPFYFTATLGTTATCAIDDFDGIAKVLKDYPDVWVHVDAAYAGSALVCPEYQHHATAMAAFDSFNFNMHKWLFTNFDCSAFFIKKRRDLTDTYSITPSYLRNTFSDSGMVTDYRDWQIPLGRRFRSLKVWFVLRSYGVEGLQALIRKHIKLGHYFHSLIESRDDLFSTFSTPDFALTCFTVNPPKARRPSHTAAVLPDPLHESYTNDFAPDADSQYRVNANELTKRVYEKVNSGAKIFITSTVVCGTYIIRVVSANLMAEEKYLKRAFDILVEATEDVLAENEKEEVERKVSSTASIPDAD